MKMTVTVIVPDVLEHVIDPDEEYVFVLTRERGRILARPAMDYAPDCNRYVRKTEACETCSFYDPQMDQCFCGGEMC